jgi:two-component system, OmpR family, response regulator
MLPLKEKTVSKILIVEDDGTLLDALRYNFSKDGYAVVTAEDGIQALEVARAEKPDAIVLDVMLPGIDGFDVCRILRKEMTVPILMLTAKVDEVDRVVGLELGADDYLTKPFGLRELMARVRALLRRVEMLKSDELSLDEHVPPTFKVAGLEVDLARHRVSRGESVIELSHREFELLTFLVRNRGQVFSRDALLERVWGYDYVGNTRTVDVHVRWLRQKIEDDPASPRHLLTVRGSGYKFEA